MLLLEYQPASQQAFNHLFNDSTYYGIYFFFFFFYGYAGIAGIIVSTCVCLEILALLSTVLKQRQHPTPTNWLKPKYCKKKNSNNNNKKANSNNLLSTQVSYQKYTLFLRLVLRRLYWQQMQILHVYFTLHLVSFLFRFFF